MSHSLIVESTDPDASSRPSGEIATALTSPEWPSSVCSEAFQLLSTFDSLVAHLGICSMNFFRIMLISGAKSKAEEYSCSGAFSSIDRFCRAKRFAS